jgi:hypothetical protein
MSTVIDAMDVTAQGLSVNFTSNALLRERLLNGYDKLTLCVMIFCL